MTVGYNVFFDSRTQALEKYDAGLSLEVASGLHLGLRHDSLNKDALEVGNILLFLHHQANANSVVASEFVLNWQKKALAARFGYTHKFNEESSGKFKVNHHGYLDLAFKHKVSNALTLGLISGFNLKAAVADKKSTTLPFGLSLDFKF